MLGYCVKHNESPKIAVAVHIYYADLLDDLVKKLSLIPCEFDLYVTTPSEPTAEIVSQAVTNTVRFRECSISVTPNIGRNFAPLLVEFGSRMLSYDLLCHVHTKKSLHTDRFAPWGKYLLDNIIGSRSLVEAILDRFNSDAICGLIYPKRFYEVPSWSQAWLGNYSIGENWCRLNGLDINPNFIDFPTGGMFWTRPRAICQLLSFRWTYDHFPAELGQIDGTMQHAIERIVGALVTHNRYRQLIYDPDGGLFYPPECHSRLR